MQGNTTIPASFHIDCFADEEFDMVINSASGVEAINTLFSAMVRRTYKQFRIRCDHHLKAEAVQECWALLLTWKLSRKRQNRSFHQYLKKIAMSACGRCWRRIQSQKVDANVSPPTAKLKARDLDAELAQLLRNRIRCLPTDQQRAIEMRYFEELPVRDIAEREGTPPSCISMRLLAARRSLHASLSYHWG